MEMMHHVRCVTDMENCGYLSQAVVGIVHYTADLMQVNYIRRIKMSRITQKMVEHKTNLLNQDKKIVHVNHRNDYYAIDNAKQNECYECGLTTREAFLVLKGIQIGLDIAVAEMKEQINKK